MNNHIQVTCIVDVKDKRKFNLTFYPPRTSWTCAKEHVLFEEMQNIINKYVNQLATYSAIKAMELDIHNLLCKWIDFGNLSIDENKLEEVDNKDSPEAIDNRKNQEDPIIMYLIVRESLNMGAGKTAAQCAHAAQMLLLKHISIKEHLKDALEFTGEMSLKTKIFNEWLDGSFRKVVLRADDKEFEKIKSELSADIVIVKDAGLTEVEPGSETVIGIWPMHKSNVPKIIKKLQVLK